MGGRELVEWQAYFNLDPFGDDRADLRTARNTNFITNVLIKLLGGKRSKQIAPENFLLSFGERKRPEKTQDELKNKVIMLNQMFGGKDLRKD